MTARKTAHIDIRVEPELLDRIDDWLDSQPIPPTRSRAIVRMIELFLDREEECDTPAGTAGKS